MLECPEVDPDARQLLLGAVGVHDNLILDRDDATEEPM